MTALVLSTARAGVARLLGLFPPARSAWSAILAVLALVSLLDPAQLAPTLGFAARALAGTAPYIIFAVLLIAWMKAAGAEHTLARAFEGREGQMIVMAALFGGLAPFCSCEVIPFIAGLLAAGAPLSAIMAFWLSSPLIDPPTMLITVAALGWNFAIAKAVFAVALGLAGGVAVMAMSRAGAFAAPARPGTMAGGCGPALGSHKPVWRFWHESERTAAFGRQLVHNGLFLLRWLFLAYLLEALLIHYVPAEAIGAVVGGQGVLPIVTSAAVGMPAYLNSYVAPPLVAGLMEQGMSAGGAMAFIIAGAVSSIPAMVAVFSLVRAPVFAAYVALGFAGAVAAGIAYSLIA